MKKLNRNKFLKEFKKNMPKEMFGHELMFITKYVSNTLCMDLIIKCKNCKFNVGTRYSRFVLPEFSERKLIRTVFKHSISFYDLKTRCNDYNNNLLVKDVTNS